MNEWMKYTGQLPTHLLHQPPSLAVLFFSAASLLPDASCLFAKGLSHSRWACSAFPQLHLLPNPKSQFASCPHPRAVETSTLSPSRCHVLLSAKTDPRFPQPVPRWWGLVALHFAQPVLEGNDLGIRTWVSWQLPLQEMMRACRQERKAIFIFPSYFCAQYNVLHKSEA